LCIEKPQNWRENDVVGPGAEQNVGAVAVRAAAQAAGGDHRQHGDRGVPAEPPQRADVSHLPGHAQEDDDDEGVPAPLLLRLHCDRPAFRQQGVPHVPQEAVRILLEICCPKYKLFDNTTFKNNKLHFLV